MVSCNACSKSVTVNLRLTLERAADKSSLIFISNNIQKLDASPYLVYSFHLTHNAHPTFHSAGNTREKWVSYVPRRRLKYANLLDILSSCPACMKMKNEHEPASITLVKNVPRQRLERFGDIL